MQLVIDVGNTRIKGAVFEKDTLKEAFVFSKKDLKNELEKILKKNEKISDLVISSVGFLDENDFSYLKNQLNCHVISNRDVFPFKNKYATPQTLGVDRLVLASGAVFQYPKQNRLVIDAGTCITYDFIDQHDQYYGGAISPGFRLRYEALHNFTAKLPLLSLEAPKSFIGDSTAESIHSGVVNGLIHEIDGFIGQYKEKFLDLTVILTGGDTEFLAKRLKNTIFANSNFLLESLNQTFHYKNQK
ncbi:type III pantothenate kinase [Flavobacterium sp. '19STA2R22 D10 B1']|uniref:type III pantothenate kinase n=1 Tax=Flavobacterium aerium TaxID=3037261 RepID=UPI00278C2CC0|nr:type III pantothenate kinase [Flavobacterium sp. '19STA2R22 D10 B1']